MSAFVKGNETDFVEYHSTRFAFKVCLIQARFKSKHSLSNTGHKKTEKQKHKQNKQKNQALHKVFFLKQIKNKYTKFFSFSFTVSSPVLQFSAKVKLFLFYTPTGTQEDTGLPKDNNGRTERSNYLFN